MPKYYVNKRPQFNGDHEVHKDGCLRFPSGVLFIGEYANCEEAVVAARKMYPDVNGCYWCTKDCKAEMR